MRKCNPIIRHLGKLFFPKEAPWQQCQHARIMLWTIITGLVVGGFIIVSEYFLNSKR